MLPVVALSSVKVRHRLCVVGPAVLVLVALGGCRPALSWTACRTNQDCPQDFTCDPLRAVCVPPRAPDAASLDVLVADARATDAQRVDTPGVEQRARDVARLDVVRLDSGTQDQGDGDGAAEDANRRDGDQEDGWWQRDASCGDDVGSESCPSELACPGGFVKVAGTPAGPVTCDFCVAMYEMKAATLQDVVVDGYNLSGETNNHKAVSAAEQRPWTGLTLERARAACADMGTGYHLITNAEWLQVARDAMRRPTNWSGQVVGVGALNKGHSDCSVEPGVRYPQDAVDESLFLPAGEEDIDPCVGTGNPDCQNPESLDFSQRRTHLLSTNDWIWDLAGNVNEWVEVSDCVQSLVYGKDWVGEVVELTSLQAEASYATMLPLGRADFIPDLDVATGDQTSAQGLGKIRFAAGVGPHQGRGLFRSGKFTEECQSAHPVGQGNGRVGLFAAWVAYADTAVFDNLGFRCAYRP